VERIVQLTPPGSGRRGHAAPESLKGLQLDVPDIRAACTQLGNQRGVGQRDPDMGESASPQPDPPDNVGFAFFNDPGRQRLGRAADLCLG